MNATSDQLADRQAIVAPAGCAEEDFALMRRRARVCDQHAGRDILKTRHQQGRGKALAYPARQPQMVETGMAHIGFRCVIRRETK